MHASSTKAPAARAPAPPEDQTVTAVQPAALHRSPLWSEHAPPLQAKLLVNAPGDQYEREADRLAEQVTEPSAPAVQPQHSLALGPPGSGGMRSEPAPAAAAGSAPAAIQRDEEDKTGAVLSEGASITYEQLKDQPGFEAWKERQTDALKLKLWDNQPAALKAGIIGFGLSSAGVLGSVFALDPGFRSRTITSLQDTNILLPLSLLPYSEYFPASGFKYKLPEAQGAPYTFETEFSFDAWFKLMQEKWNTPQIGLSVGVESSYQGGFSPVTGGNIKLKLGGGIVNLSAYYNQPLPPTPVLISDPTRGEPPMWLMRTLPGQLEENLPRGSGIFLTVDVLRLPQLFSGGKEKGGVQRAEDEGTGPAAATIAPPAVEQTLRTDGGMPLDRRTRRHMESRFGQDFSQVRIHTSGQAAESARSIHAKAYTSGTHIVFGSGRYQPHTREGQRLLAHELVHVVQQTGSVRRKEADAPKKTLAEDLKEKLAAGDYQGAYGQLAAAVGGSAAAGSAVDARAEGARKQWLADNEEIRQLFLQNLPADLVAGKFTEDELLLIPPGDGFAVVDCWYQAEAEKQLLYAGHLRLFDYFLKSISPYTGADIVETVRQLVRTIAAKDEYTSNLGNAEFHTIHLLAPTVERKIEFYARFDALDLFKTVKKKFDPYTGLTRKTMAQLTDTNEVDRDKALEIYNTLKQLPEEQRRAFIDTALFAGALEADKDAEKYYKKTYKDQYKALPHNWDFAFFPWNWGEAPFADRLTVDHVALMSAALNYEDLARRKFGFDKGLPGQAQGGVGDAARLLEQLQSDRNFNDERRLAILLAIAVRGGLENDVTSKVLVPKNAQRALAGPVLKVVESYGFVAADGFRYHDDKNVAAAYDDSRTWYIVKQTLFGGKSGEAFGNQRGTFDLRRLQATSAQKGSLGGLRFGTTAYGGDDYYNDTWLDAAVKATPGASELAANLQATQGKDRTGKIFATIRDDLRQAHVFASTLPVEGLNYFSAGALYRSGPGVLQGLAVHLSWTKDTDEPDNSLQLQIDIDNLLLNQFELVGPASTLTLGQIGVKGFRVRMTQGNLAAAKGIFLGMFKNADFMLNSLILLLPNVLKLLPYAVMTMVEEFKGAKVHVYKDLLGQVLKNDFSSLDASVTFTDLEVRNLYDTAAGFLDDISIQQLDEGGKPVRQGVRVQQNMFWTTDALFNLRARIRLIDEEIRTAKSNLAGTDHAARMAQLEAEKDELLGAASEKSLRNENRDAETNRLRAIMSELRWLQSELDSLFEGAKSSNPKYDPTPFRVLEAERARLLVDLDYIDNQYFEDKKLVESSSDRVERFKARRRMQDFEARYKSVDVRLSLRGVTLHGGGYVRDMINATLTSVGLIDPQLQGIENINIGAVDSSFAASGLGVAASGKAAGVAVRDLHLPLIMAPAIALRTPKMLLEGQKPQFEDVHVSVRVDFDKNPLAKDPARSYTWLLQKLTVGKATFNGLTVKVGSDEPLLDFPAAVPVEAWGLVLANYDPAVGSIDLKIQDVKAQGVYKEEDAAKKTSRTLEFGVDSTQDGAPRLVGPAALDLRYDAKENSIATAVNIGSVRIRALAVQSPGLAITSVPGAEAVQLDNVQADAKVVFGQEASGDTPATPTVIDINSLHIDKTSLRGISVTMTEVEGEESAGEKKKPAGTKQVVTLPQVEPVTVEHLDVKGLRVTLDKDATRLGTVRDDASLQLGKSDLGGIQYKEMSARGSVLTAISLERGKFDSLTLQALGRKGRQYTLREFFKFFGHTELAGADLKGRYAGGKNSGVLDIQGKQGAPITIDYVEPEGKPGYYKIRLPLKRVALPALHVEKDEHIIDIPKAKNRAATSSLDDVDVQLRAYVEFDDKDKVRYDVYLDSLQAAVLNVYGLQYHNKAKGIEVLFDPVRPLHVPNIKAGGFRFSSAKAFDVFGKDGGWIKAAAEEGDVIGALFDKISAALSDGTFLAESDPAAGRSALDVDIASFGFTYDKAGNIAVHLGKISGGFPKLTVSQTDPDTGAVTKTTISSANNKAVTAESVDITLDADQNTVVDAKGLAAGDLTLTRETVLGKETSKATLKLDPAALGAQSAVVKLNADKSQEITVKDIRGGKINLDLLSTGAEGKSENTISLPDPESIQIDELKILQDAEGNRRITVVKPTIKNVTLRHPSQETPGDYTKITCDLLVGGSVELGDGNFDTLTFADPKDAFVGMIGENVPVEIKNLRLEIQDTSKSVPAKDEPAAPLTPDQQKLIDLEKERDSAETEMNNTPSQIGHGDLAGPNPKHERAAAKYWAAAKAYEEQKAKIVGAAKAAAQASMTKKYLDAVSGTVTGSLQLFDADIPINIESYQGQLYVELSSKVTDGLRSIIKSLIGSTIDMPFWSSEHMKAIGEGLKRWWTWASPTARADLDAIASGNAIAVVLLMLQDMQIWPGVLDTDKSLYGINMNLEGYWGLDITSYDSIGMGLCELKYKHPAKDNFYSLYGMIEHLQYVSPALVSASGQADEQRLAELARLAKITDPDELAKEARKTAGDVGDMGIGAAVNELVLYIKSNLAREAERLKRTLLRNIKGVKVNADVSLRPQEVISALLKEKQGGTFTFDKGKDTIGSIHAEGTYTNRGVPDASGTIGGGAGGSDPIVIPGATWLSQDKAAKVTYDSVSISPLTLRYKDDIYKLENSQTTLKGLKFGVRKKPKKK